MPRSIHPDDLSLKYDDRSNLARSEVNSLIRGVQQIHSADDLYRMQYGEASLTHEGNINPPIWFPVFSQNTAVAEYSVFTVKANPLNRYHPFSLEIAAANDTDPVNSLLTNGGSRIDGPTNNKQGLARFIDWQQPVELRYGPQTPLVNEECGPVNNGFTVDRDGVGLICLALDQNRKLCKVIPSPFAGVTQLLVKTTVQHDHATMHPVDVWNVPSGAQPGGETLSNPKKTFNAFNRTSVDIPPGKFCIAIKLQKKFWYIVPWEC